MKDSDGISNRVETTIVIGTLLICGVVAALATYGLYKLLQEISRLAWL